jgi:hypothetical protein
MICYFMNTLCHVFIRRFPGCKRRKEMKLSYKAYKGTIYWFQLPPLEQSQVRHVGNLYNEYKYSMGKMPEL